MERGEFENTDQDRIRGFARHCAHCQLSTVIMVKELLPQSGHRRIFLQSSPGHAIFCCCTARLVASFLL